MDDDSVTMACQNGDTISWEACLRAAGSLLLATTLVCANAAAGPLRVTMETVPPVSAALHRELERGVTVAQGCEGEIDADLQPYVACIEHQLAQRGLTRAARAGVRFQAWLMADLALQQNSEGAATARLRWWRALQRDLVRSRLTLDQLCTQRGLSCADVRLRASRMAPLG